MSDRPAPRRPAMGFIRMPKTGALVCAACGAIVYGDTHALSHRRAHKAAKP